MNFFTLLFIFFGILISKLIYNTITLEREFANSKDSKDNISLLVSDRSQLPQFDQLILIERLSKIIQFPSIYYSNETEIFESMWKWIKEEGFPNLFSQHCHEIDNVAKSGKLIKCPAQKRSKNSIILTSHLDVVPSVDDERWTYPPFSGKIDHESKFLYGRGTLDDKTGVIAILESLNYLYSIEGWKNLDRDVYIAVGMDEEIGGENGAQQITDYLLKNGEKFSFALDEGGVITDTLPGLKKPVFLIAIAEKGFVSLKLSVSMDGGHSSYPIHPSAAGIISNAIANLDSKKVPINSVNHIMLNLLYNVAPYSNNFFVKMVLANQWLFGKLINFFLSMKPRTDASLRTTTAVTIIKSGIKSNVVPSTAEAIVNFRIAPGDSVESIIKFVQDTIQDNRIKIEVYYDTPPTDPSPISCTECNSYSVLSKTSQAVFPDTIVTPYLFIASSDSKHYRRLTSKAYGAIPYRVYESRKDFSRIHGIDERISFQEYTDIVNFFYALTKNLNENLIDDE